MFAAIHPERWRRRGDGALTETPPPAAATPRHIFLVDGSGFIFRAFFVPQLRRLSREDGTPTGAVYGFTNMMMKLLRETDADHIAVIFDAARRTFRNDLYAAYKANRPEPPEELIPQFPLVREATRALNVACVEQEGFEADDLIATYTRLGRQAGARVTIVSSDKDLMQLVGNGVEMLDPINDRVIGPQEVRDKFGVGPDKVIDVQALSGDQTDNIPGVPGIGVKTAAQLIEQYGDLETLLGRAAEIKQPKRREALLDHAEDARISRELVRLRDNVTPPEPLEAFAVNAIDVERLGAFLEAQGFKSLLARIPSQPVSAGSTQQSADAEVRVFYESVQDLDTLDQWIADALTVGRVAVDTETTSLDALRADLVGVSLAVHPGRACYIPIGHKTVDDLVDGSALKQLDLDDVLTRLRPLLEDRAVLKVGQNIKYDMHVFSRYGISVGPIDDTMLLSYVLEGGLHGHGMDELALLHLGIDTIKFSDVAGSGRNQITFDRVPVDRAVNYAAEDADVTLRLHQLFKPRLVAEHMVSVYETIERPLVSVLASMEREGILVDRDQLALASRDFGGRIAAIEDDIHRLAGRVFNVGSPKQLGQVLFDEMGLPGGKKGKTGAYATGAEVLETLAAEGHELPRRVLEWRQLSKLKSTYADALLDQINPETGRVHTVYSQAIASTGRLASSDPNLQNIPVRTEEGRKIRRAFIARSGTVLLSADYSQIELRLLAHVADIAALKDAFRDGIDIHALTAAQVFGVPVEGMDPMVRRRAKAINFGIIYGISAFGLARQLSIPRNEAGAYIDAYFQQYPGIRDYMSTTKEAAQKQGYVTTLFGRKCHVRGINDRSPSVRNFAERVAINAPIQGGAADIIKRAMIRVPGALAAAGLSARMLLQVHDELVFEVPEMEVDRTRDVIVGVMESVATLDVPLVVDTGFGKNWNDAH